MAEGTESVAEIANKYYEEMSGDNAPVWYGQSMDFLSTVVALHGVGKIVNFAQAKSIESSIIKDIGPGFCTCCLIIEISLCLYIIYRPDKIKLPGK